MSLPQPEDTARPGEDTAQGLSSVAYDSIMRMILSRELTAGAIVQERRLADGLGMSRTPVREALRRLEAEGWLVRLSARTIAVKQVLLDEYIAALQVREMLEPEAAAIAAGRIDPDVARQWRRQLRALMRLKRPNPKQQWEFDESLHLGLMRSTGNRVLAGIVEELRKTTQLFENQTLPARPAPGHDEHLAIIDAIERGDSAAARQAMAAHLRQVRRNVLEVV